MLTAGQSGELVEGLVGEGLDVVEEERTLRGDGLHVAVLVLHMTMTGLSTSQTSGTRRRVSP